MGAGLGARPVLIAGGGIGGLAAALGLAQKGIRSVLLEKASALGEIGAGIQLGPNAFHAFDYLGVGEAARSMAVYIDQLRLMDALTAEEITHVDLGEAFRARFGNPYAVVHRGDLHGVFLKACRDHDLIELRVSSEVVGYEQDGSSVTAKLASGERVTGALLIGADGLWSNIRKQVAADGPPRVSGHTTYRSVIPTEEMPEDLRWNAATLWAGPKCHIVHYPLSGWKVFNLVVTYHNDAPEPVAGKPVSDAEVMQGFSHVHERAQAIIRHGRNWRLWVLCDRDPIERWIDGRVALLGDAAHPMMQYFAQGACQAMEDAVCLSHMLGTHPDDHARRWKTIARNASRAPRACNCYRARSASTSTTPTANTPGCATRSWARKARRIITATWRGCMAGRGWRDNLVVPASTSSFRGVRSTSPESITPVPVFGAKRCKISTQGLWIPGSALRAARNDEKLNPYHRLAVDLAGAGLRQFVDEGDFARVFIWQQFRLDVVLQRFCRLRRVERAVVHHHDCLQPHAPVRQFGGEHRAFPDIGVLGEAQLDFERIHPLAGDFYQVVGPAAEEMKAVAVADEAVAGVDPAALADRLGRLVRPVPVQGRVGIAAHPQNAFFVVGDVAAIGVAQPDIIAGHAQARRAELFRSGRLER